MIRSSNFPCRQLTRFKCIKIKYQHQIQTLMPRASFWKYHVLDCLLTSANLRGEKWWYRHNWHWSSQMVGEQILKSNSVHWSSDLFRGILQKCSKSYKVSEERQLDSARALWKYLVIYVLIVTLNWATKRGNRENLYENFKPQALNSLPLYIF